MRKVFITLLIAVWTQNIIAQPAGVTAAANKFLELLNADVKAQMQFAFEDKERFNWHYVPRYRSGVSLHDLTQPQLNAALDLLKASLSVQGFKKATDVMALESVLREVENRGEDDSYRDPKKYFFSIFGSPAENSIWGWRLEGHHISLNFSTLNNVMVSATPSFFGSNPATIPVGKRKGEQILKDESALGFSLINSLSSPQQQKAIINDKGYPDILSENKRKASSLTPTGILYAELNEQQQKTFLTLLDVYVKNYELGFSKTLMDKIKKSGIENLSFAWAGSLRPGRGHYYRIQGPMLLIEFDNTQNDANHIHSVVRDLTNDFAEDILKEHYEKDHVKN